MWASAPEVNVKALFFWEYYMTFLWCIKIQCVRLMQNFFFVYIQHLHNTLR